jgi:hypothetical protein
MGLDVDWEYGLETLERHEACIHFDNEKLLADCAKAIANGPPVSKARVRIRKADLSIGQGGVGAKEHDKNSGTIVTIEEGDTSRSFPAAAISSSNSSTPDTKREP